VNFIRCLYASAYDIDAYSYKQEYKRHRRSMINAVLESSKKLDRSLKSNLDMQNSMEDELDDNDELSRLMLKNSIQSCLL